jgi:MFS family permease
VADRFPRRDLLLVTQASMLVLAFALAGLTALHWVQPWHVLVLALLGGVAQAFDAPARQSFVLEMVDREDLGNAIALNSAMFNLALTLGPAAAGIAYAAFGPALCFFLNGVSFIAVIVALQMMRLPAAARPAKGSSVFEDLKEGVRYAVGHPTIRAIMLLTGTTTLFGFSFVTLIPAWAVEMLHGDARTNGYLFSARGVGALAGALLIASTIHLRVRGRLMAIGAFAFPTLVFLFSLTRSVPMALALTAVSGVALIMLFNVANALVQTQCPDRLRGRVMGVYSLVFFGLAPLGALWVGPAAQAWGSPWAVKAAAIGSFLCCALVFWLAPELKELE